MAVLYHIAVPEKVYKFSFMGVVRLELLKCNPKYIGGHFKTGLLSVLDRIFKELVSNTSLVMFSVEYPTLLAILAVYDNI